MKEKTTTQIVREENIKQGRIPLSYFDFYTYLCRGMILKYEAIIIENTQIGNNKEIRGKLKFWQSFKQLLHELESFSTTVNLFVNWDENYGKIIWMLNYTTIEKLNENVKKLEKLRKTLHNLMSKNFAELEAATKLDCIPYLPTNEFVEDEANTLVSGLDEYIDNAIGYEKMGIKLHKEDKVKPNGIQPTYEDINRIQNKHNSSIQM